MIFFSTLTARGFLHRKEFKWKEYRSTGLISEKTEALSVELNKRIEEATSIYFETGKFFAIYLFCDGG